MKYAEYKLINGKKTLEHGLTLYERLEFPLQATREKGVNLEATLVDDEYAQSLIAKWGGVMLNPKP